MADAVTPMAELVGESPGIMAIREQIARLVARASDVRRLPPVLIQGETGSGKGLVARALHRAGPRSGGPFVDVNCAAIPETLLEAEMFGFERGAFTDARQAKRGLFQAAHRGTLFLDEIGALPQGLQAKLLTVLEERTVRRLGATQSEPVDVWIIAATNLDLQAATRAGRFREDLYHRLAVLTLTLPPLRERQRDILLLAEHFLARACADYGIPAKTLAPDARKALVGYRWPGNVRELINTMERVVLLAEAPVVTEDLLGLPDGGSIPEADDTSADPAVPPTLASVVDNAERAHLQEALDATGWNVTRAAARLGISRNTIRYRIEKHGLRPGAPAARRRARQAPPAATPSAAPAASAPPGGAPTPVAIRWERRRLAVLQATLTSGRDAGPLDTGRVIEALLEKARSFGGRVEELGASGFVALFGLDSVEDAMRRAALAAVAMQRAAQRTPGGDPGLAIRIGLDLGSFLLGRLQDASLVDPEDKRLALGAMGALLEGVEPGTIVVSAAGAPFLVRGFDLMPLGAAPGRRSAFRFGGIERGEAASGRRPRFVGRDDELDLLKSRLAAVTRGQGQVVAIAGEAGIGKSRLIVELRRGLSDGAILYLEGHCLPYATPIPCLPLVELLRGACAIVETDGPDGVREKLRATLERAGMDTFGAMPCLLHLLDPGEGREALDRLSPEVVKSRTFEALRELSRRLADRAPLVLVVEDMHWVDRTSEEYLGTLVDVVGGARILLVTTHRPGYRPPWMDKSYATQVALQPLSPRESLSLARDVIGPAEVDEPTVEMIVAKADGNPFFMEELARAVAEGSSSSTPASTIPDTIEGVLMARIDRLAAEDKRVLQAAAVIGRSVPFLLLQMILEPANESLREQLARLQGAEFLYETRAASELEYTFKHALTHEVAYASLLPEQRRALHARIVDVLESWQREGREEHVERLAHHAIQAEAWEKAVSYARRAGRQALARSAHQDAAAWFDQAVGALAHLPERRELLEQAIDLQFDLRNALWPLAEFRRVFDCLKHAEQLATTLGDQRRLAMAFALLTPMFSTRDERAQGIEYGRRALEIGTRARRHDGAGRREPVPGHGLPHARQLLPGDEVRPEECRPAPRGRVTRPLRSVWPPRAAGHSASDPLGVGARRARRVRAGSARAGGGSANRRDHRPPLLPDLPVSGRGNPPPPAGRSPEGGERAGTEPGALPPLEARGVVRRDRGTPRRRLHARASARRRRSLCSRRRWCGSIGTGWSRSPRWRWRRPTCELAGHRTRDTRRTGRSIWPISGVSADTKRGSGGSLARSRRRREPRPQPPRSTTGTRWASPPISGCARSPLTASWASPSGIVPPAIPRKPRST